MINFSKVARQLNEEPMMDDGSGRGVKREVSAGEFERARQERMAKKPIKRKGDPNIESRRQDATGVVPEGRFSRPERDGSQGGMGFWAEKLITQHILPKFTKGGAFKNIDVSDKGHKFGVKTDIYQDKGGDPKENTAYSVKSKMDNDLPQKVHQTSIDSQGAFTKMNLQDANQDVIDAIDMYLGKNGTFTSPAEMKKNNPELHKALKEHLTAKKLNIFNNLVRQQGSKKYGKAYENHDPRMIDALISHRVTGENNSGPIDIRDFNGKVTEENFENLQWFDDGKRFFLGENEEASTDERMLDLWPIDEEGSRWSNRVGDGGPQPGGTGYTLGKREVGLAEPGQLKATMATNPEFLEKYFPKVAEWMMDDDGRSLGFKDTFKAAVNKTEPESKPEAETYADGTPKDDIPDAVNPDQGQRFGNFMKKAAMKGIDKAPGAANVVKKGIAKFLQKYREDGAELQKQNDQRREATPEPETARTPAPYRTSKSTPAPETKEEDWTSDIPSSIDKLNKGKLDPDQLKEIEDAMNWIRQGEMNNDNEVKAAQQLTQIYNGILQVGGQFDSAWIDRVLKKFYAGEEKLE